MTPANPVDDALRNLRSTDGAAFEQRRSLRAAEAGRASDDPEVALDDLPELIRQVTSEYLNDPDPQRALLLALPAGSGKTTAMVALAESMASAGKRVMYSGPRHDLFDDLMAMSQRRDWWYHWQPRRQGNDTVDGTCRWAPQMERWLSRGYDAMKFCHNPRVCGFDYASDGCPYHAQRRTEKPIIYAMHQHVAVGHPLLTKMSLLIGDELPLGAMLHPWLIPAASIVVANADRELERVLWSLRSMCDRVAPEGGWNGPALLDELGGHSNLLELINNHAEFQLDADLLVPNISAPEDVDSADYLYLPTLMTLLRQECEAAASDATDWIRRVHCTVDGLRLLLRRRPKALPSHVIWCDATGDARMYERLLGMPVQLVRPNVRIAGTVYQIHDSLNNRTALKESEKKIEQIKEQITQIKQRGSYKNTAVITYKANRELFDGEGHFYAERGTNRLADRDALIVIGTPQSPQHQIIETAAMLHDERMLPFNTAWTTRDVAYDGHALAYPVAGFWDDPDLQVVLQQLREAELIQTLHRARPLRRKVDVWLLTNLPLRGVHTTLMSVRELFDAPAGIDPYRWPELIAWAREMLDSSGMILSTDITRRFGVSQRSAVTFMHPIAGKLNLTVGTAPKSGRGRPQLAISRDVPNK